MASPKYYVIVEPAKVKNGKEVQLLNSDKHSNILKKHKRELGSARPDITHQTLLCLMDSPLNRNELPMTHCHYVIGRWRHYFVKNQLRNRNGEVFIRANLLQVYIRTTKNVLIEINPQVKWGASSWWLSFFLFLDAYTSNIWSFLWSDGKSFGKVFRSCWWCSN